MDRRALAISTKRSVLHEIKKTEFMMDPAIKKLTNDPEKQRKIKKIYFSITPNSFTNLNRIQHIPRRYLYNDMPSKYIKFAEYNDKKHIDILNQEENIKVDDVLDVSLTYYMDSIRYSRYLMDYRDTRTRCMNKLIDVTALNLLITKYIHMIKYIRSEAKDKSNLPLYWGTFSQDYY